MINLEGIRMGTPRFSIFVDGGCGLCAREARLLVRLDRGRGRLRIIDLHSPELAAIAPEVRYEEAMRSIHGQRSDGTIVRGVEVFREAYRAVGLGWLWAPTAWPGIRTAVDALYSLFAAWRFKRRVRQGCGLPNRTA